MVLLAQVGLARHSIDRTASADMAIIGRTTFVNTLCGKTVLGGQDDDDVHNAHISEGVRIKPVTVGKL